MPRIHRGEGEQTPSTGQRRQRKEPIQDNSELPTPRPDFLCGCSQGQQHIVITLSDIGSVYTIKVDPQYLTKGTIPTRAAALAQAEKIGNLSRTAEELEVVDNIEIIKERLT
jgi:hypothetical protein